MLSLYVFVFGIVFGGRFTDSPSESTLDYALGVFLGLCVMNLVSGTIGSSPTIIVSQPNFVKKSCISSRCSSNSPYWCYEL